MKQEMNKQIIPGLLTRLWRRYKYFVNNSTSAIDANESEKVTHWRDRLFTSFITYLFPVCLIALVPGVFMGIKVGDIFIAGFDVATVVLIAVVVFNKKINLTLRKFFVIFLMYCLTMALIVNLGLLGPGLVYLLMMNILVTLFFSRNLAYWSVSANVFICAGCAFVISLKLFNSPLILQYTIGTWIAVSSNLIYLSCISVVLIGNTINSLEDTINKELTLKSELILVNDKMARRNKSIKESEIRYRSLFFLNPLPMWVLDNQTLAFLQVNESALNEYGYTNEEFMGMTIGDIKLEKDMTHIHQDLRKPLDNKAPSNIITQHRRKNKEEFYVEVRYNSFLFNGEEATLSIVRDMTEQINFTKALETQNIKLKEIAWIQSHLVRAPLARIMGLIDLITRNKNQKPDADALIYLDQSAREFDEIIKTITSKTEQV